MAALKCNAAALCSQFHSRSTFDVSLIGMPSSVIFPGNIAWKVPRGKTFPLATVSTLTLSLSFDMWSGYFMFTVADTASCLSMLCTVIIS